MCRQRNAGAFIQRVDTAEIDNWYGEHKLEGKSETQYADGGIHCYYSSNLISWKDEGIVLSVDY